MKRTARLAAMVTMAVAGSLAACTHSTAPAPMGDRYVLVSINGNALPTRPAGFTYTVLADTLQFGMTSSYWKPKPLAVARRHVVDIGNSTRTEEWWMTYDSSEPLPSPFAIRLLCADGDQNPLADCINGNGRATLDSDGLTISFDEPIFGVLKYARIP